MAPALVKTLKTRHGTMLALPHDQFVGRALEVYGEFSRGELELLLQIAKPGATVVEVGSNIGAHTIPLARACRPGALYAFEPQRRIFQILCANLVLNDIDNVVALPQACGPHAGTVTIPPQDYGAEGNFGGVSVRPPGGPGEQAPLVRLDDLALSACELLKIDAEGSELDVLAGAADTIARLRPILYVENDRPRTQRRLIATIAAMGYRLYWHTPPLVTPDNFNGVRHLVFDRAYVSINMLCVPQERRTQTDLEAIDPANPHAPQGGPGAGEPLAP